MVPASLYPKSSKKNRHRCPVCRAVAARQADREAYERQMAMEDDY